MNLHSDSEVDDYSTTPWQDSEFRALRKPLPSRSAHLTSEPTAPARFSRRRNLADDRFPKNDAENKLSSSNLFYSVPENESKEKAMKSKTSYRYLQVYIVGLVR